MLIQRTNPKGIDLAVQRFQKQIHDKLITTWGLAGDDTVYKCYSRCYRNKTDNGYVAENYEGGNEYREVYWDDTLTVTSFFGTGYGFEHDVQETVKIHLVFFANLTKLKPSVLHRADEEVRLDVLKTFTDFDMGFKYTGLDLWIENVLREYHGSRRDERLKVVDMHPVHCFRMNFELTYNKNIC